LSKYGNLRTITPAILAMREYVCTIIMSRNRCGVPELRAGFKVIGNGIISFPTAKCFVDKGE
jgi:hypothetical protein